MVELKRSHVMKTVNCNQNAIDAMINICGCFRRGGSRKSFMKEIICGECILMGFLYIKSWKLLWGQEKGKEPRSPKSLRDGRCQDSACRERAW